MTVCRIYFHVGYPKSGTTAIQKTCSVLRRELLNIKVSYPEILSLDDIKHEEIFRYFRLGQTSKVIAKLKAHIKEHSPDTVFISTESIVNQLHFFSEDDWFELFRGLKSLGDLEVLLVCRERDEFLKSYYKQAVVNSHSGMLPFYATGLDFDSFVDLTDVRLIADFDRMIAKLVFLSGKSIKVFDYSQNIVSEVLSYVIGEPFAFDSAQLSNKSLEPEQVEFVRQVNIKKCSVTERNSWLRLLSKCFDISNSTVNALASRATDSDLVFLDESFLLSVKTGFNGKLGVTELNLSNLLLKLRSQLNRFQKDITLQHSVFKERCASMSLTMRPLDSKELEFCVLKKVESLINSQTNGCLGKRIVDERKLELAPFEAVSFSGWHDWERDPLANRSWQWRLNWLSFLPYLMAHHNSCVEVEPLELALEGVISWIDTYIEVDETYPFEFVWHDHGTALRAEQLCFFFYYCREYAPDLFSRNRSSFDVIEKSILVHGDWLAKDSFYSEHTNHGLEQARVLLMLGNIFEGNTADSWKELATQRIISELNFAFTSEGVHVENSPAYHVFVFKVFINIIKDYPGDMLGDLSIQFEKFSLKALSFITHILRPDSKLPPIGDTEQLSTSDAYKSMFGDSEEYEHFLYSLSQGKQGIIPRSLNKVYRYSGYAVFRDYWPTNINYQNAIHLIVKAGCLSKYHHQQDEGHISLFAGSEDWLIDSGLYNYINNDPIRKYMRRRAAHNIPIVANTNYEKDFEHRVNSWEISESSEGNNSPYVTLKLNVLRSVEHVRRVALESKLKQIDVTDELHMQDAEARNVTLLWHFPKDKNFTIGDNQVIVSSPSGNQMVIWFLGETPDNISSASGFADNRVLSCISYKANQVESSKVLRVMFKNRENLKVTTRFKLTLSGELHAADKG